MARQNTNTHDDPWHRTQTLGLNSDLLKATEAFSHIVKNPAQTTVCSLNLRDICCSVVKDENNPLSLKNLCRVFLSTLLWKEVLWVLDIWESLIYSFCSQVEAFWLTLESSFLKQLTRGTVAASGKAVIVGRPDKCEQIFARLLLHSHPFSFWAILPSCLADTQQSGRMGFSSMEQRVRKSILTL